MSILTGCPLRPIFKLCQPAYLSKEDLGVITLACESWSWLFPARSTSTDPRAAARLRYPDGVRTIGHVDVSVTMI
jgi:hypothetical protein